MDWGVIGMLVAGMDKKKVGALGFEPRSAGIFYAQELTCGPEHRSLTWMGQRSSQTSSSRRARGGVSIPVCSHPASNTGAG